MTQGHGPEMFTLPKAAAGKYPVRVKYFAQDANRASTRTKVYATIYEGLGTPQEKVTRKTVTRLALASTGSCRREGTSPFRECLRRQSTAGKEDPTVT